MKRNGIIVKCNFCNGDLYVTPYYIKNMKYHYCNMECRNKHYKIIFGGNNHPNYGNKISLETINKIKIKTKGKRRSPNTEFKKGYLPSTFKGYHIDSRGYVLIYSPNHPNKNKKKSVYEHRLIIEKSIGRFLKCKEVVHHINGNKSDNRLINLMLFNNNVEHIKYHAKIRKRNNENNKSKA